MSQILYYHKCDDCLTPFSSTERHVDLCDCEGHVSYMGQVSGNTYKKVENRPACDGRCTDACGPICDCECGGINHGSGKLVATVVKEGKVKVADPSADILDEMKRGYKYREFRDYAWKMCERETNSVMKAFMFREVKKIVAMRVYDPRLKALVDFIVANKGRN